VCSAFLLLPGTLLLLLLLLLSSLLLLLLLLLYIKPSNAYVSSSLLTGQYSCFLTSVYIPALKD